MLWHTLLFAVGALGYGGIEMLWRGHTHWAMLLCGGFCLLLLQHLARTRLPFLLKCAAGSALITGIELAAGLICNVYLHWGIWDYSTRWCNFCGQICPLYSLLWFLLCMPILAALQKANRMRCPNKTDRVTSPADVMHDA